MLIVNPIFLVLLNKNITYYINMSTQLRKLSLYPELRTNEGIDGIINYIISLEKGFGEVYPESLNTRQMNRYEINLRVISQLLITNFFIRHESQMIKIIRSQ